MFKVNFRVWCAWTFPTHAPELPMVVKMIYSLYIKYLCGLLVQPEIIEMILMSRIYARKKQSTWTASHMHMNFSKCVIELMCYSKWTLTKNNFLVCCNWIFLLFKVNFRSV
jgi:hypothetical protein